MSSMCRIVIVLLTTPSTVCCTRFNNMNKDIYKRCMVVVEDGLKRAGVKSEDVSLVPESTGCTPLSLSDTGFRHAHRWMMS